MPEVATQQQNTSPTSFFRKIKKLLDIIIIPIVLLLVILCILAWAPWVTDSFAHERVLSSVGSSCRELQPREYEPPVILAIYKIPTLRERLGLEPLFGNKITLYLLCDGKGQKNEYFVSFYGSTKLVSSGNVILKSNSKKDETADWKTYTNKVFSFEVKYPTTWNLVYYPSIIPSEEATTILFDKFPEEQPESSEQVTVGVLVSANEDALLLRDFIIEGGIGIDYPLVTDLTDMEDDKSYRKEKVKGMQETTFQDFAALQYGENRLVVDAGKSVFLFYIDSLAGISVEDRKIFIQILSTFKLLD